MTVEDLQDMEETFRKRLNEAQGATGSMAEVSTEQLPSASLGTNCSRMRTCA